MKTEKISSIQLFILIFLFEMGSSVVVGVGLDVKQDAWLAILFGMGGGILLFIVYSYLFKQFPELPLTCYIEKIFGKMIGRILAIVYIVYFLYIAARVLRDFADLIVSQFLPETPLFAVALMIMATIVYGCFLGFEVIARTGEVFFPWYNLMGVLFTGFIFVSGLPKIENLQPILDGGWKPFFTSAFPTVLTFPFGELIVFTILLPYLSNPKKGLKAGLLAVVVSGVILMNATATMISVLGPYMIQTSTFPLLRTIGKVNVADVFQRLDPIAIILLMIGGFFKIVIFFCGGLVGFSKLFNLTKKQETITNMGMGGIVIFASIFMSENYVEHIKIGLDYVPKYIHLPLQVYLPLFMALIIAFKKTRTSSSKRMEN